MAIDDSTYPKYGYDGANTGSSDLDRHRTVNGGEIWRVWLEGIGSDPYLTYPTPIIDENGDIFVSRYRISSSGEILNEYEVDVYFNGGWNATSYPYTYARSLVLANGYYYCYFSGGSYPTWKPSVHALNKTTGEYVYRQVIDLPGPDMSSWSGITCDTSGNIYVNLADGATTGHLIKYNSTLTHQWTKTFSANESITHGQVTINPSNNHIYFTTWDYSAHKAYLYALYSSGSTYFKGDLGNEDYYATDVISLKDNRYAWWVSDESDRIICVDMISATGISNVSTGYPISSAIAHDKDFDYGYTGVFGGATPYYGLWKLTTPTSGAPSIVDYYEGIGQISWYAAPVTAADGRVYYTDGHGASVYCLHSISEDTMVLDWQGTLDGWEPESFTHFISCSPCVSASGDVYVIAWIDGGGGDLGYLCKLGPVCGVSLYDTVLTKVKMARKSAGINPGDPVLVKGNVCEKSCMNVVEGDIISTIGTKTSRKTS